VVVKRGNAYRVLVGKPGVKKIIGSTRHMLENNIKMDLIKRGWGGGMNWINLVQDRD
jgi:hypothetical protein